MKIGGFQKMTMLDYPGKIAATVFTYGCNLRCPFCHNARLVVEPGNLISEDEVLSYLKKRAGILDGVCISGGEPLLQPDLFDFLEKVKALGLMVKLDTNGSFPERLKEAIDRQLVDAVAMDIKNSKEKYPFTVGCKTDIENIEKSINILMSSNIDYEFRTTVVAEYHKKDDIEAIARWIKGAKKYFLQPFVDSGNLIGENLSAPDEKFLKDLLNLCERYIEAVFIRGA